AGLALGSLGLALTGVVACAAMERMRRAAAPDSSIQRFRYAPASSPRRNARLVQVAVVPLLAAATVIAAAALHPLPAAPAPADALTVAAALLAIAFPTLVAERMAAGISTAALPEAQPLRALMLLPVVFLPLAAVVVAGIGVGFDWASWGAQIGCVFLALAGIELAARALGQLFLPPPAHVADARAPLTSLLAALLAGSFGRHGLAGALHSQLGIDFARSWALRYLRAAAFPALLLTALLCWGLSGVVALPIDQRAVYERLGAPASVLNAGLHLVLPWPLGRVRRVDGGTIRELVLGVGDVGADRFPAEAPPPPTADRLWDRPHPGEAAFLIASETQGRQGFQIVDADVRVLWRIGLGDEDARRAVYDTADPEALLREATGRVLARFFAARTLDAVLGERRETLSETIRRALTTDIAPLATGIEVLDVAIEAVHPPAGAAAAYHAVQAAAIESQSAIAREQGRARATLNQSQQEAHRLVTTAVAAAAETVQTAHTDAVRFDADRAADRAGGTAFRLERYFADIAAALASASLTIVDHRLADAATGPVIDLRPLAGQAASTPEDPD
ncbi:MAG TPA: SPFH domain-containing protein, partial [Acetobacteraceae bacterium]|nr:SPFH domain-containing protein [Acetobacteraceae bacterium]